MSEETMNRADLDPDDTCGAVRALLVPYLDREASPGDVSRVEAHVAGCVECARELDAHRAVGDALRPPSGTRATPAAPGAAGRIRLLARRRTVVRRAVSGAIAAALVLAAAVLLIGPRSDTLQASDDLIGQLEILESFEAEGIEPTDELVDALLGADAETGDVPPADGLDSSVFLFLLEEELSPENL